MHPVVYIEIVSALACLAAIVFLIRGWKRPGFLPAIPILILTLLLLMMFYVIALLLEWLSLAERFHWNFIEDFASIFIPFIWAFVFYAIVKNVVEEELKVSREHFRNLVEFTSDWIWEVDAAGRYTYVSPHVQAILGYTPEEIIGKTPFDLMAPDEAARVSVVFAAIIEKKAPLQNVENINLHKNGREVALETNAVPIFDDKGNLIGYRGIDRDITRRLETERLEKQHQAELDSVFRASPAGIGLVRNRYLVRGNERFFEITGYPEDELIGADPRRFYLTDHDYLAVGQKYTEAITAGFVQIETRFIRKDKAVIDVVLYLSPLERDNADAGFVIVIQDITEFKAARQQAMVEKTRAQIYLDVVNVMILVLDTTGHVKLINKKGCELLERSVEQVEGADWFKTFLPLSYRQIARNGFQRILDGDEKSVAYFENPICTPSGAEKLIAWRNTVLRDESGKIVSVISSGEDITEARRDQDALRESDERLRVALSAANMGIWRYVPGKEQFIRSDSLNVLLGLVSADSAESIDGFFNYVHLDDRDKARKEFEQALGGRQLYYDRFRIVRPEDGAVRWVLCQGQPLYDYNGKLDYVTGVMVDVTEQKETERQLQESEAALRKAQQIARLGFYDWDLRNDTVTASEGLRTFYGCEPDEDLTFELVASRVHPEDQERFVQSDQESRKHGTPFSMDYRVLLPDGTIRWAHDQSEVSVDEQGNKVRMFGIIQDITGRKVAEQKLRFNQFAIDHACEEAMWVDSDMKMIYVNDLGCQLLGYTRDELLQMTISEIDPNYTPDIWPEHMKRIRKEGTIRFESLHKRKDGKIFPVEVTANYVVYDGKEYNCAFIRDITERKLAEQQREELMQQLQFTQFATDHVGEAAYWMIEDGRFIYVNEAACKTLGYSQEELLQMSVFDIDPDFTPEIWADVWQGLRTKGTRQLETYHKTKDGRVFPVEIVANFVEYDGKEYDCAFARDITERKAAEQAREKLMQQLQLTQFSVDHASDAAFWMGSDAKFIYVNDMACQSLGYSRDELLQMAVYDIDPDFPAEVWSDHWAQIRVERTMRFESHHKKKDGQVFSVEITGNFVNYDEHEYLCAFARDITNRKAAEQTREVLMRQVQNRNDELQSIVFTAAHDLRSPLVNIDGFTGELEKGLTQLTKVLDGASLDADVAKRVDFLLKTDLAESLRFVKFGNQQMDMLLGGLMRLSRVGSAPMKLAVLDMNELFEAVVRGFQYQIKTLDIDVSIQKDLPDCTGDYSLLAQVFINLLDNAIKYRHPDRAPVIEIGGAMRDEMAEYTITDNGIGIEPEQVEVVFDLFHRLDHKPESEGEGLGLTIVRRILDRQQGSVQIDSKQGLGTTVYVRLPGV